MFDLVSGAEAAVYVVVLMLIPLLLHEIGF